jgi:hypothetical protein
VQRDERLERVRVLRERGQTPKQIARALGIRPAEAGRLVRAAAILAQAEAPGPAVAGCWISPGWSAGLIVGDHSGWPLHEDAAAGADGLVAVLVARRHRHGKVSVCGYLADVYCLGVKNALGPEIMDDLGLRGFVGDFFSGYHGDPLEAPIGLAREVVLGSTRTPTSLPPGCISVRGPVRVPSPSVRRASRCISVVLTTIRVRSSARWNAPSVAGTSSSWQLPVRPASAGAAMNQAGLLRPWSADPAGLGRGPSVIMLPVQGK